MFIDHYIVLGLPNGEEGMKLDENIIKHAYKVKALELHPDKRPLVEACTAKVDFQKLQDSFQVLMDPQKRQDFHVVIQNRLKKQATAREKERRELARKKQQSSAPQKQQPFNMEGYIRIWPKTGAKRKNESQEAESKAKSEKKNKSQEAESNAKFEKKKTESQETQPKAKFEKKNNGQETQRKAKLDKKKKLIEMAIEMKKMADEMLDEIEKILRREEEKTAKRQRSEAATEDERVFKRGRKSEATSVPPDHPNPEKKKQPATSANTPPRSPVIKRTQGLEELFQGLHLNDPPIE